MRRSGHLAPLGAALEDLLARREARVRAKERLAALVWRECVGTFYAERTEVTGVSRGTLYVWCSSPALAHQLSLDAEDVIRRLNAELAGEYIKELRPTAIGRGRARDRSRTGPAGPPTATRRELDAIRLRPTDVEAVEADAARIADGKLRDRFAAAALAQRRTREWRRQHGYRACTHCGWLSPPPLKRCTGCGRDV
jgi:predicted nucleic acid-binding Zn ribbon protein